MADLFFTAYSVTTVSSMSGNCVTYAESRTSLDDAYTVPVPRVGLLLPDFGSITNETQEIIQINKIYTSFLDDAYSSFYGYEGYEGCTASIPPSQYAPNYLGEEAAISATASFTPTPTPGHLTHHTRTIILSVVLPTLGLMILLLCFIIIRRYRKKRSHSALAVDPKITSDTQLYLDQKAELEDDQRRRHELEAGRTMYEMDGQDTVFEMPGDNNSRMQLASSHRTHELRGPDHTQELEVPGNV